MQEFKVLWASSAAQDLERIVTYIADDSPGSARRILAKIKEAVSTLCHSPHRGRFVPELQGQGILLYRELVITPWRVMYKVSDERVFVVAIFDSRQNIEDILLKKLTFI